MRTRLAVAALGCLIVTGCGSSQDEQSSPSTPSAAETGTPTETPAESPTTTSPTATPTQSTPVADGPALFPRVDTLAKPGRDVELADGLTARIEVPKGAVEGAELADGDAELVVNRDGTELRAPIPAGPSPMLFETTVDIEGGEEAILVLQSGGDAASYVPFTFIEDQLAPMVVSAGDVELRSDTDGVSTWVGPDRDLVTVVTNGPRAERGQVYRWVRSPQDLATLDPEPVGQRCFDWQAETVSDCG